MKDMIKELEELISLVLSCYNPRLERKNPTTIEIYVNGAFSSRVISRAEEIAVKHGFISYVYPYIENGCPSLVLRIIKNEFIKL